MITDHGDKENRHGVMSPVEMNVPGIQKGIILAEPNNNTNSSSVILRLFGFTQQPKPWVGEVPETIFE